MRMYSGGKTPQTYGSRAVNEADGAALQQESEKEAATFNIYDILLLVWLGGMARDPDLDGVYCRKDVESR